MKKIKCIVLFLLIYICVTAQQTEKWFISNMANAPIGYVKETTSTQNGLTTSGTYMRLIFNRKDSRIEMLLNSETTENDKGEFVAARGTVKTTGQDIALEGILINDSIQITMSTGGQSYKSKVVAKEKLDVPGNIRKKSMALLKQPGDSINYVIFSPDLGLVVHVTRKLMQVENMALNGAMQTVYRVKDAYKENPYSRELIVDKDYNLVKTIDASPFGKIESTISTKQMAEVAGDKVLLPAESWDRTVIASNVRFTDPRNLEQVTYKITLKNNSLEFPDLSTANQKVIEQGKDYAVVQYNRLAGDKNSSALNPTDLADYLNPNSLINSDDPEIIKIAKEVSLGMKNNFEKAVAIKNWVSANVKGDLGVALAPGSEVCKTRKGTCVAFSTFFASLLRAAQIPARYMGGYVYMNGIWGGHAWVEIYYNGSWIPMDATINVTDIADAARISFGDGWSLKNGIMEFAASRGSVLFGNADIKVVSYIINGQKINVDENTSAYSLINNVYKNPGKKMQIKSNGEFEFKKLDELWPSKSFATISFAEGEVKIMDGYWMAPLSKEQAIKSEMESVSKSKLKSAIPFNGAKIYSMEDKTKAFFIVTRGKDMLMFYANGTNPAGMLKKLLVNTKLEQL